MATFNIETYISVNAEDVAAQLRCSELVEFVKELDEAAEDPDFTEEMYEYFKEKMNNAPD